MADRVERLTNLLAVLLETRSGLSLREIAAALDGQYPTDEKARRQAFERDKLALREIGVPIEMEVQAGDRYAGQTRYRIDRASYELDDLDLAPDEMRALQVAVATVRTDSGVGRDALLKLGGGVGSIDRPPVSAVLPDRPELPADPVGGRVPLDAHVRVSRTSSGPSSRGVCCCVADSGTWSATTGCATPSERFASTASMARSPSVRAGDFERPSDFDPADGLSGRPEADRPRRRRCGRSDGSGVGGPRCGDRT